MSLSITRAERVARRLALTVAIVAGAGASASAAAAAPLSAAAVAAPLAAPLSATPPSPPPSVAPAPCAYEGAPPDARCGTVEVPLDRANPGRGTTRVGFALVPRRDGSRPSLGTVVPNPGGPGAPATQFVDYAEALAPLLERRELLLVDPRGTGLSGPIDCRGMRDPAAGFSHAALVSAIGACGRELGPRAGLYGSAAVADDIDAVRAALGLDRLDLWGDSYGTYLMTVYAARHPEHVRSVVLSGAYPIAFDGFGRDRLAAGLRAIRLICDRTGSCDGAAVRRDLERVASQLRRWPIPFAVTAGDRRFATRLDEQALAAVVYARGDASLSAAVPPALASAVAGDVAPLQRLAAAVMFEVAGLTQIEAFGAASFAAVVCHDYPRAFSYADPLAVRRTSYRRALATAEPSAFAPFSAAGWAGAGFEGADLCLEWPNDPAAAAPVDTSGPLPDVPVLVLSGDLDANTPSQAGREAAAQFPYGIFAEVANVGHTPTGDPCGNALGIRFVETLAADPDSCRDAGSPPPVPGRAPVWAHQLPLPDASAPREVRRALAVAVATVGDLAAQRGVVGGWGAADGLRGGRYEAADGGAVDLTDVRVVRDARASGRLAFGGGGQVDGELRTFGLIASTGRLRISLSLRTGVGHATGRVGRRAVDVDFRIGRG